MELCVTPDEDMRSYLTYSRGLLYELMAFQKCSFRCENLRIKVAQAMIIVF